MNVCTTTDRLFEAAYNDLCRIARGLRTSTGAPDPAALVHEAYLRYRRRRFEDHGDRTKGTDGFLLVMALAMRTVARDRRRRETAIKRGGRSTIVGLDDVVSRGDGSTDVVIRNDVCALREVLRRLASDHPEWFAALFHHDLAGRTIRETADRMGIREASVRSFRRAGLRWLRAALG